MRTEEEVRRFYKDYVFKHAKSNLAGDTTAAQQYFGAAIACGRTLGKDVKRIQLDFKVATEFYKRKEREEN